MTEAEGCYLVREALWKLVEAGLQVVSWEDAFYITPDSEIETRLMDSSMGALDDQGIVVGYGFSVPMKAGTVSGPPTHTWYIDDLRVNEEPAGSDDLPN